MSWLRMMLSRARALFQTNDAEFKQELESHVQLAADEYMRRGMSADEARRQALVDLGGVQQARESYRDQRTMPAVEQFLQDVRYGLRTLRKAPTFAAIAVATLAIAIGVNTAVLTIVNAVALQPLPYRDAQELVVLRDQVDQVGSGSVMSYPEYLDWSARTELFQEFGAYFTDTQTYAGGGLPQELSGLRISASLLPMLGIAPALGRNFLPEEEQRGAELVAIITHSFWQREFNGKTDVIGKPLRLSGLIYTIVGVLPADAPPLPDQLSSPRPTDYITPLRLNAEVAPRGLHFLSVVARLREGLPLEAARQQAQTVAKQFREQNQADGGLGIHPYQQFVLGDTGRLLVVLSASVMFVLLIACANLANLLLARSAGRQHEISMRLALGATRARIVRQMLTESLLLALIGGAAGVLLAYLAVDRLAALVQDVLPRGGHLRLDTVVLLVTAGLVMLAGVLFGLAPALRASGLSIQATIQSASPRIQGSRDWLRRSLVVGEVALALMLVSAAGLMMHSFVTVLRMDKGFDPSHLVTFQVHLPSAGYPKGEQWSQFFQRFTEKLQALPGVEGAAVANETPLGGGGVNGGVPIEGRTFAPGETPLAEKRIVSPGYFSTMRIPVLRGRALTEQDRAGAPPVVLVSQSFAERYFSGEDPLGKRVDFGWETTGFYEIVGIVADVRQNQLEEESLPAIYISHLQRPESFMTVVVRSSVNPADLQRSVREQLASLDPERAVANFHTMDELIEQDVRRRTVTTGVIGAFALVALLLAGIGTYGVLSYLVAQRTREIGIRMALGATRMDVYRHVFGESLRLVMAGVAVGVAGALFSARLLAALLYGTSAVEPSVLAGSAAVLIAAALLAAAVPARRATRVDPMIALRYD